MKRMYDKTAILTDDEVAFLLKHLRELMTKSFPGVESFRNTDDTYIRMMSLSENCKQAREELDLTIKDVAAKMRVPQYRLRSIEKCSKSAIQAKYLRAYIEFLGLVSWARRWASANPALARTLGIDDI